MSLINNSKRYSRVILFLFAILFACKKQDDSLDSLAKAISGYTSSYVEKGSALRINGIAYNDTTIAYRGFPVSLSAAAGSETVVKATIDTTLIAAYNAMYGEKNRMFDSTAFKLSNNGEYHIKTNQVTSADSLYVLLKSATKLVDSAVYLIPVRLTATNGAGVANSIVFFKMFISSTSVDGYIFSGYAFNTTAYPYPYSGSNGSKTFFLTLNKDANGQVIGGPDLVKFNVFLRTRFALKDLNAYAAIDISDSSIKALTTSYYNYVRFPEGTYELVKNKVTVPANGYFSSDSLSIRLSHYEKFQSGVYYLMGIKLVSEPSDIYSMPPMKSTASYGFIHLYINN